MDGVVVKCVPSGQGLHISKGSAGLATQVSGAMTSVSNLASASGGIKSGNLVQSDIK